MAEQATIIAMLPTMTAKRPVSRKSGTDTGVSTLCVQMQESSTRGVNCDLLYLSEQGKATEQREAPFSYLIKETRKST